MLSATERLEEVRSMGMAVVVNDDRAHDGGHGPTMPGMGKPVVAMVDDGVFDGGFGSGKVNPATGSADPTTGCAGVSGEGEKEA
ncbi:hypothetical protein Droror1_Dr00028225 [Drosera rotundifolia]